MGAGSGTNSVLGDLRRSVNCAWAGWERRGTHRIRKDREADVDKGLQGRRNSTCKATEAGAEGPGERGRELTPSSTSYVSGTVPSVPVSLSQDPPYNSTWSAFYSLAYFTYYKAKAQK